MIALCLLYGASTYAQPTNLIDNPGFEDGLREWSVGFGEPAKIDREVSHSGAASARISVREATSALDATELLVGPDIDPSEPYRVSAWLKSGGIEKGDCGGRAYCYDSRGKVLIMHTFGKMADGTPPGDWHEVGIELRPGGPNPIPEGTDRVVVRFSIWAQDGECTGTVWVDDVSLTPLGEAVAPPPAAWLERSEIGTVVIWQDSVEPVGSATDPERLASILSAHGMAANLVSATRLAEAGALNQRWVDLVILPYGGVFPADARDAFLKYVRYGGSFLTLGGLAFEKQVRLVDGEWMEVGEVVPDDRSLALIADFDGQTAVTWDPSHSAEDDAVSVEEVEPGAAGTRRAAHLSLDELRAYAYGGLTGGVSAPDPEHPILSFWARGDEDTKQLAIEPREQDGSRWKKVVPLNTEWQRYTIPAAQFLSYATEDRGGPGDHLHPERVASLWFGFTRGMVGGGPHAVWLDQIAWAPALKEAGAPPAPMRPPVGADLTFAAFGSHIDSSPVANNTIPVSIPLQRIERAAALRAADGQFVLDTKPRRGRFSGYLAPAPTYRPRTGTGEAVRIGGPRTGRLVPLLEAVGQDGGSLGPMAALFLPSSKLARDAVWAFSGIDNADVAEVLGPAFDKALCRVADIAAGSPMLDEPELHFATEDGRPFAEFGAKVRGRPADGRQLGLIARVSGNGKRREVEAKAFREAVKPAEAASVRMSLGLFRQGASRIELELRAGGDELDREIVVVDTRQSFLDLANWLLTNQAEDGTYSGVSFQDNRAARGLLGAYEITGDVRYRDSAIRWGEEMVRLQRDDGGYRMGYGITDKGESCYVADGGEVAIAMARLVTYAEGERRQRFIDSVRAYMGYRESFREPNGAIGVGWCLHDYGQRPIVPLDKPTRIFSGETNQYTIGCTLAAAAAYATITGDPKDKAMALQDTEWLLEHYHSLSGAAAESAVWAHRFIADEGLKRRIEDHMRESFRARIVNPADRSWLAGSGRTVLDLDPIEYWLQSIDPEDAEMQAARARWVHALCGSNSTSAVRLLLENESRNNAERRFLCFAVIALADAVQPMVSLRDL